MLLFDARTPYARKPSGNLPEGFGDADQANAPSEAYRRLSIARHRCLRGFGNLPKPGLGKLPNPYREHTPIGSPASRALFRVSERGPNCPNFGDFLFRVGALLTICFYSDCPNCPNCPN